MRNRLSWQSNKWQTSYRIKLSIIINLLDWSYLNTFSCPKHRTRVNLTYSVNLFFLGRRLKHKDNSQVDQVCFQMSCWHSFKLQSGQLLGWVNTFAMFLELFSSSFKHDGICRGWGHCHLGESIQRGIVLALPMFRWAVHVKAIITWMPEPEAVKQNTGF